jgi:hypothetical protein
MRIISPSRPIVGECEESCKMDKGIKPYRSEAMRGKRDAGRGRKVSKSGVFVYPAIVAGLSLAQIR